MIVITTRSYIASLYILWVILVYCFVLHLFYEKRDRLIKSGYRHGEGRGGSELYWGVNIVPPNLAGSTKMSQNDCIPVPESPREGVRICIPETTEIATTLRQNVLWNGERLHMMERVLMDDPTVVLLDVGFGDGLYTLWAAAMGRNVIAVDMRTVKVRMLQNSLSVSGLTDRVTVVHNAIYTHHSAWDSSNVPIVGGMYQPSKGDSPKTTLSNKTGSAPDYVRTICLDDLAPMLRDENIYFKLDIDTGKRVIMVCARKFFRQVKVKVIQMNWHWHHRNQCISVLELMARRGFLPSYRASEFTPVDYRTIRRNREVMFFIRMTT